MIDAVNYFEMFEDVLLMPDGIPVTIVDEGISRNGVCYYIVECNLDYYEQQLENPTDGFNWSAAICEVTPDQLRKK